MKHIMQAGRVRGKASSRRHLRLPVFMRRRSLFWDVDPKTIDPKKHARYIIERILDFGTDDEVRWMWGAYNKNSIRDVVDRSRALHVPTRVLWRHLVKKY